MKKITFKQVKIQTPCSEKLSDMEDQKEKGHYCFSCKKNVIDFRNKTEEELNQILKASGGKMCGLFNRRQIGTGPAEIPAKEVHRPGFLIRAAIWTALALPPLSSDSQNADSIAPIEVVSQFNQDGEKKEGKKEVSKSILAHILSPDSTLISGDYGITVHLDSLLLVEGVFINGKFSSPIEPKLTDDQILTIQVNGFWGSEFNGTILRCTVAEARQLVIVL